MAYQSGVPRNRTLEAFPHALSTILLDERRIGTIDHESMLSAPGNLDDHQLHLLSAWLGEVYHFREMGTSEQAWYLSVLSWLVGWPITFNTASFLVPANGRFSSPRPLSSQCLRQPSGIF